MIHITDYLRPEAILFETSVVSKLAALRMLAERLLAAGAITDAEACLSAVFERERLMTTGIGKGVALPHAFSTAAPDTSIAYLRIAEGVDFDAVDEQPIHHMFLILGPPTSQGRHLKILARLARLLSHEGFVGALESARGAESLLDAIRKHEEALQPAS